MPQKIIGSYIGVTKSGLYDPDTGEFFGDSAGDYFMMQPEQIFKNDSGENLWLVKEGIVKKITVRRKDLKDHIYEAQKKHRSLVNKRTSAGRGYLVLTLHNGE